MLFFVSIPGLLFSIDLGGRFKFKNVSNSLVLSCEYLPLFSIVHQCKPLVKQNKSFGDKVDSVYLKHFTNQLKTN